MTPAEFSAALVCSVSDCERPVQARGWCRKHYERWRLHGDPHFVRMTVAGEACSVEGCGNGVIARGMCGTHYSRWRHHGDPTVVMVTAPGLPLQFLDDAVRYTGDDCLIWPYAINSGGYAHLQIGQRTCTASRIVCLRVHGDPTDDRVETAHSCGNSACVNPRHLRWATPKENSADRDTHGTTARGEKNGFTKLNRETVLAIREAVGTLSHAAIGRRFGINTKTVGDIISRRNWKWL
jgi:hypothetical protein